MADLDRGPDAGRAAVGAGAGIHRLVTGTDELWSKGEQPLREPYPARHGVVVERRLPGEWRLDLREDPEVTQVDT